MNMRLLQSYLNGIWGGSSSSKSIQGLIFYCINKRHIKPVSIAHA